MVSATPKHQSPLITWEKLPNEFVLPDGFAKHIQQPTLAAAVTDALVVANRIQPHMLVASNFGVVSNIDQEPVIKAPDWLYVPRVHPVGSGVIRRSYTPYTEGEGVAVVMEFLSEVEYAEHSIRPSPPYGKLYFYEHVLKVPTYIIFDPYIVNLEVRRFENGEYALQEPSEGLFWIPELELFLGIWQGTRPGSDITNWLRWWDSEGNLLLWSSEQAEAERQRAELFATKLRELGVDLETL
jgi:hypothetical protein